MHDDVMMGTTGSETREPQDYQTRGPKDHREPEDHRTRKPEDHGARGPNDQSHTGTEPIAKLYTAFAGLGTSRML